MNSRLFAALVHSILAAWLVPCVFAAQPFAERIISHDPVRLWMFPDPNLEQVGAVDEIDGPPPSVYPAFPDRIRAAAFDGSGYFRLPSSGADPAFQFTTGDTITIETWVRCDRIGNGHNQYIIGKGRTHRDGYHPENQNWALRLRGEDSMAKLSFLFRSESDGDHPGEYHRWTSERGFYPGGRWHHLAVTYQFGDPESMAAWVDGQRTGGRWDMGMATSRPPVVDDDEVWIGSARGGERSGALHGALACLALYRHAVPGMEEAYEAKRYARPLARDAIPPDRVLVEVFQADSGPGDWPGQIDDPLRTFDARGFALFDLPPNYGPAGQRLDQSGVYLLRLAGSVTLSPGDYSLRLRAPGMTQLNIGDEKLAALPPARIIRDAHGPLRDHTTLPRLHPRLGTRDEHVEFHSDGEPTFMVIEALVGDPGGKIQLGELVLAAKNDADPDAPEFVVAPRDEIPFTAESLERYRQNERAHHDRLNAALRRELAARSAPAWEARHRRAAGYIESLPPVPLPDVPPGALSGNVVDRFLHAKIARAKSAASQPESGFRRNVRPLLEEHCFRCHGEKRKGGLRLDSRTAALEGGDSGPAVVPNDPEASELLRRVSSDDPDERMPPKGDPLAEEEIAALTTWIAQGARWDDAVATVSLPEDLDERSFLRRLYLDTVGVVPTPQDVRAYLADDSPDKTARLIDRLLADPRHADHWVSYWQDVLAENPRLVKPMLNNTGPFRYWIHEALLDHKPFDRFVTELVTFHGGVYSGGAGGFELATQNDVPMAAKAHVIGTAFLGLELKCARCHDAPFHSLTQKDLFSMAAMLKGSDLRVPDTSSVPPSFFDKLNNRESRIEVTLDPDTPVQPAWPFGELAPLTGDEPAFESPAAKLAYQITRPENRRFAQVVVNRLWNRHFGQGIVEPAGDWESNEPSHPHLLDFLAREFVAHGYDLRHVSRLILNSAAYRRAPRHTEVASVEARFFEAPLRRRLTAEQLVDSLFAVTGTPVFSEELTFDVEGWYPNSSFINLGRPRRAWEFVSLSTERDRPSLILPHAQAIVSFLEAYGWRSNRTEPLTERPAQPDVLQAGLLANGLLATWWTRLSDYSELTRLAVQAESPQQLIDDLYLRLLTRQPSAAEREALLDLLEPGFDSRLAAPASEFEKKVFTPAVRHVSWRNHLDPEANRLSAELETAAAQDPPPTDFLSPAWREQLEDAVWSLLNSPEIQFAP